MSLALRLKSSENLLHLRGANLYEVLARFEASDLEMFRYKNLAKDQFIAKLGMEELLICSEIDLSDSLESGQYAFQRGDAMFELSGDWKALMSEVCIYDFRQSRPGDFLMASVAGVSVWMLLPEADEPLILGCDPTYGHYLLSTLQRQLEESPFLNME
ncbi:hypothetical protein QCB45_08345 [Thiomicrorhabdus sp. ZW0627]|uniref:hypothetical protein n=1 Tax=Thiomicrorhabdus sp. ZW0627 TaxID=3039774 RepID=UPI0024363B98|nr:hypothetical protein [Thiomicrorhabdus sp. ZW0627]MDG6774340.1 hypothetical protein [Thiomicrorhabdus sp. ZW0627]